MDWQWLLLRTKPDEVIDHTQHIAYVLFIYLLIIIIIIIVYYTIRQPQ